MKKAVVWTDSRYWTQAERQMDCNWELHKEGERGPTHVFPKPWEGMGEVGWPTRP